uniref:Uncharacterized protein n=1 Tax=Arundo donax TaxID=35708 RepID=A0A0A8Z7W3_ARUDO
MNLSHEQQKTYQKIKGFFQTSFSPLSSC